MNRRWPPCWHSQKVRFLVVGGCNTIAAYGIFIGLYALLHKQVAYQAIAVIAHFASVGVSFTTQRCLVFTAAEGGWLRQFLRFNISHLATLALGFCLLIALVEAASIAPPLAQLATTVATTVCSYLMHRCYSFKTVRRQGSSSAAGGGSN